jgi:hypothetical protein
MRDTLMLGKPMPLLAKGPNLRLWLEEEGEYEFRVDVSQAESPWVVVKRVTPPTNSAPQR